MDNLNQRPSPQSPGPIQNQQGQLHPQQQHQAAHSHQPIQPHDTYNLQGVIRYLQLEWSRAEEQRINWQSDRAELKSIIGKLTGEIRSLKEINRKLNDELNQYKNPSPSSNEKVNVENMSIDKSDFTLKINEPNMNPLIEAKKFLKEKKDEIDYILKDTSKSAKGLLELNKKHILALQTESLARFIPPQTSRQTQHGSVISPLFDPSQDQGNGKQAPFDLASSSEPPESDAETVIGSIEVETPASSEPSKAGYQTDEEYDDSLIAELTGHLSEITQLSVHGDLLLSNSKDGIVKVWNLLDLVKLNEIKKIEPLKTIYNSGKVKAVKWINDMFFLSLGEDNVLKVYNSKNYRVVQNQKLDDSDAPNAIRSLDLNKDGLVVAGLDGLKYFKIELTSNGESLALKDETPNRFKQIVDLSIVKFDVNEPTKFYGYSSSGNMDEFDLKTKSSKTITLPQELLIDLNDFKIFKSHLWLFSQPQGFKLYSKEKKSILYTYNGSPNARITNVDLHQTTNHNKLLVYFNNGTIDILESNNSCEYSPSVRLNHYDPSVSEIKFHEFSVSEKDVFHGCRNLGLLYGKDKVITGGEDGFVRVFGV